MQQQFYDCILYSYLARENTIDKKIINKTYITLLFFTALFQMAVNSWKTVTIVIYIAGYIDEFDFDKCLTVNVVRRVITKAQYSLFII